MPGTPLFVQAGSGDAAINYAAQDFRRALQALTASTERVLTASAFQVVAAGTPNFTVSVSPGQALVQGDNVTDQSFYLCTSSAADVLTVPAAPASGTRTHRVVLQVRDRLHGVYPDYAWESVLLPDTGAGLPPVPASALPLARISVAAGQTSVTNANILDQRVGPAAQAGIVSVGVATAGTAVTVPVVFPVPFAARPALVLTPETSTTAITQCTPSSVSATGFDLTFNRTTTVVTSVHWHALAMTT